MKLKPTTHLYLNRREAGAAGFHALTVGYRLPQEQQMLDRVLADLRRDNIPHSLVKGRDGVAVWRAGGACTHGGFAAAASSPRVAAHRPYPGLISGTPSEFSK